MSIGLTFTGRIEEPEALTADVRRLAQEREYHMAAGEGGLRAALCPMGIMNLYWKRMEDGLWAVRGECISTPAGAGLHRAAVELVDRLPLRDLRVEDETGFWRHRDFRRIQEEHFYPWLRTLVDVCRQESGKGVSGMALCWDLEQYGPEDIPDTIITPMGRFRLGELVRMAESGSIQALADRFFLWDGRVRDARFYRNRAINALWERCWFAPSSRSEEDAAVNASILNDLERAARMDPRLPMPRDAYQEVCALADRSPALRSGPALEEEFQPGYRKGLIVHAVGPLRLTLPGVYRSGWEQWANGGGAYLWSDGFGGPVWRLNSYRTREGNARFTDNLDALHGVEQRNLKGGALRWGWKDIREGGQTLYQVRCEVITGPALFLITVTCADPNHLGLAADLIGRIQVVSAEAKHETVQAV